MVPSVSCSCVLFGLLLIVSGIVLMVLSNSHETPTYSQDNTLSSVALMMIICGVVIIHVSLICMCGLNVSSSSHSAHVNYHTIN